MDAVTGVTVNGTALTVTTEYTFSSTTLTLIKPVDVGDTVVVSGTLSSNPVNDITFTVQSAGKYYFYDDGTGTIYGTETKPTVTTVQNADGTMSSVIVGVGASAIGTIDYGKVRANPNAQFQPPQGYAYSDTTAQGAVKFTTLTNITSATCDIEYIYNNEYVPQNDLPLINARLEGIHLEAKVRRIAVYFSQIAAFQAKTDYGFDLQEQLAQKAAGELAYEIDTECVKFLYDMAVANNDSGALPVWSRIQPVGVNYKLAA